MPKVKYNFSLTGYSKYVRNVKLILRMTKYKQPVIILEMYSNLLSFTSNYLFVLSIIIKFNFRL